MLAYLLNGEILDSCGATDLPVSSARFHSHPATCSHPLPARLESLVLHSPLPSYSEAHFGGLLQTMQC